MASNKLPQQLCSRSFDEDSLRLVRNIIQDGHDAGLFRTEIARRVCIALNWRTRTGALKEMGARVALLRLHRQGWIHLPAPRNGNGNDHKTIDRLAHAAIPEPPTQVLSCSLAALGTIWLHKVEDTSHSLLWDGLIEQYHYLGHTPLSGAQIRYLIFSERGLLGAIGFGAAAFALKGRDDWIGWSRQQCNQRREFVLNNRRFLLLPWVRVKNLASHVLSKVAHQLQRDFHLQYGYTPMLLETFVEQDRFSGGCYRAANWIPVGATTGRGRNDRSSLRERRHHGTPVPIKQIWLYPLRRDARKRLCAPQFCFPAVTGTSERQA